MNARQLIAENIRRARIISKTSISEFSARTKISERKIKEYESGDKFPSIQDLYAISKETKLSLDFFIDHIQTEVRLRGHRMPEREKKAIIELARHKARAPADLAIIHEMELFKGIPKQEQLSAETARQLGENLAAEWSNGEPLVTIFEKHGIFIIKIPAQTALFQGAFILREGVPIIAIPERERDYQETVEDISYGFGHAVFLNQCLKTEEEELLCDAFSEGFSKKFIDLNGEKLGSFDFVERAAVEAWRQEKVTASFAAEAMGISTCSFLERNQR